MKLLIIVVGIVVAALVLWFGLTHRATKPHAAPMEAFFQSQGGALTKGAMEYLVDLLDHGQLPGVAAGEHGYSVPDSMSTNAEQYSVTRTVHFTKEGQQSKYHYTVRQVSKYENWRLKKAWQTDENGGMVQEFPIHGNNDEPDPMMDEKRRKHPMLWIGMVAGVVLLVAAVTVTVPFQRSPAAKVIHIRFNSKGTARLGPISLRNEKVRNVVLSGIHRVFPKTKFELAASEGAPFTNVVAVLTSLITAGVPVCTMVTQHITPAPTTNAPAMR